MGFKWNISSACSCKAVIKRSLLETSVCVCGRQRGGGVRRPPSRLLGPAAMGYIPSWLGQLRISFSLWAHQYLYRKFHQLLRQDLPFWVLSLSDTGRFSSASCRAAGYKSGRMKAPAAARHGGYTVRATGETFRPFDKLWGCKHGREDSESALAPRGLSQPFITRRPGLLCEPQSWGCPPPLPEAAPGAGSRSCPRLSPTLREGDRATRGPRSGRGGSPWPRGPRPRRSLGRARRGGPAAMATSPGPLDIGHLCPHLAPVWQRGTGLGCP